MKQKFTLLLFCFLAIYCIPQSPAQTDSSFIHNFNFIRQALAPLDSATRSTGTQVEKSGFDRWEQFWSPRIGLSDDYAPMVQATNDYVQVFTVTSIKKFQHD